MSDRRLLQRLGLAARFPRFIPRELRHTWRARILAPFDVRFGTAFCGFPRTVNLKVTNVCNLRCRMCGQWGDTGFHHQKTAAELSNVLSVVEYRKIIDECSKHRPDVYIWGGEPFLYHDIDELVESVKSYGLFLSINTNGTRLSNHADRIVQMGVDLLIVSVDGIRDDHEAARGKGSFDAAIDGLKSVLEARRKSGKRYPLIAMACTITNWNHSRLAELRALAQDAKVDHLDFGFPLFLTEKMGQVYQKQMMGLFGVEASSWTGFVGSEQRDIDIGQLAGAISDVRKATDGPPMMFFPELKSRSEIEHFLTRPSLTFGRSCFAPWTHLEVQPDGKVYTCHDFPDLIVGDLRRQTIHEVWRGEKMQNFRDFLRSGKLLSVCGKCCRLYE